MKKKKITENQIDILNSVGSEQKERAKREKNVILFRVTMSTTATEEERTKEDEKTICDILDEIGISKAEQELARIKRFKENPNKTATPAKPWPVRVSFGATGATDIIVEEVLKKAKVLKDSRKYKSVFFNKDLTVPQIVRLKQLIQTKKDENSKLDAIHIP